MGSSGPLAGVRVADLSWIIAGPYGTYLLARMGAEVIKIEGLSPTDHTRENPPFADRVPGLNRSGFFNSINAGKKSVTLQLSDAEQAAIARRLVLDCDVVVEAFTPGTLARFGLDYETLRRERPDVIMVSCTGFGQTGRDKGLRAYMGTVHAYTGLNSLNGYEGGPPKAAGGTWADYATGLALVFAVLAALRHRRRTGCGQHVDLAMSDVVLSQMGPAFIEYFLNGRTPERLGNRSPSAAPNGAYPCAGSDAWVAIAVETDAQWQALCGVVDDAELCRAEYRDVIGRVRHRDAIDERLSAWTRARTPVEATEALQRVGVPAAPSSSAGDLLAQPQLAARGFFVAPKHSETGPRAMPDAPWRIDGGAPRPDGAPLLGEHNEEVLSALAVPGATIERLNEGRDALISGGER